MATQRYAGDSRKRCQLLVPASSEVTLGGGLVDLANIVGIMKTPEGSTEHCLLKKMPDGQLGKDRTSFSKPTFARLRNFAEKKNSGHLRDF